MNFFACCSFIPLDKTYIYMKSSKKKFRGIVVLKRDLVGKSEPKCDQDFGIPNRVKQKSATVLISSVLAFVRDTRFSKF